MKRLPILALMLLVLTMACHEKSHHQSDLRRAEQLMFIHPDSSLMILSGLDSTATFNEEESAWFALLMTQARSRNYIRPENDSLIRKATEYYSAHRDIHKLAWCYVYLSDVNSDLNNDSIALNYIREAHKYSSQLSDTLLNYYVEYFWGNLLSRHHPYDESIHHLIRAKDHASTLHDPYRTLACLNEIGENLIYENKYDDARKYLFEALGILQDDSTGRYKAVINEAIALSYFAQNNYSEALKYINTAIEAASYINNYGNSSSINSLKGSILISLGQFDSAEVCINKNFDYRGPSLKMIREQDLGKLETARGNYKKAIEHLTKYNLLKDSLESIRFNDKTSELNKRYNLLELRIEKEATDLNNRNLQLILVSSITVLLIVIIGLISVLHKHKCLIASMEMAREQMVEEAMVKVQADMSKVVMQERENSAYLAEYIMKADQVIKKVRSLKDMSDSKRLKSKAQLVITPEEGKHLVDMIDLCYNGLISGLKHKYPTLTDLDMTLCAMIKLGISNHDILLLLSINEAALKKRKYRIRTEKLYIKGDTSLEDWLNRYDCA